MARVTVAMPACNEEICIRRAIESVLRQTFSDYQLVIANNASTDATLQICLQYSSVDPRIQIVNRLDRLPAVLNFSSILADAKTEFFAFLAADDFWEEDYLQCCIQVLDSNPFASAATVKTFLTNDGEHGYLCIGTSSIAGFKASRVSAYLNQQPSDNCRFYGLHRTKIFQRVFRIRSYRESFHAFDWAIMALSLWHGSHIQVDKVLLVREATGAEPGLRSIKDDNKGHVWLGLPLLPMTLHILRHVSLWCWPLITPSLIRINLRKLREYRVSIKETAR